MTHRIAAYICVMLFVAGLGVPLAGQSRVEPFSADYKISGRGTTPQAGKVYYSGDKARLEMPFEGHTAVMLLDAKGAINNLLIPDQHVYVEQSTAQMAMRGRAPRWSTYNPSDPCANATTPTTCEQLGSETIAGHDCQKWLMREKGSSKTETLWMEKSTGIPIRNEGSDGSIWELSNIQTGKPDSNLFAVPSGYMKVDIATLAQGMRER